jgi:hypothetical protein
MEALQAAIKKHNIYLDTSSTKYLGPTLFLFDYAPSTSSLSINVSSSFSHEWLINSQASYHMAKDKEMFSSLNDCNNKNIYVGDDIFICVVGSKQSIWTMANLLMYYVFLLYLEIFYQCTK